MPMNGILRSTFGTTHLHEEKRVWLQKSQRYTAKHHRTTLFLAGAEPFRDRRYFGLKLVVISTTTSTFVNRTFATMLVGR